MAKCVRVVGQGIPVRMTDKQAFQLVERDKDGEYCSKRVWKDHCAARGIGPIWADAKRIPLQPFNW